jgi:hypothetical protein
LPHRDKQIGEAVGIENANAKANPLNLRYGERCEAVLGTSWLRHVLADLPITHTTSSQGRFSFLISPSRTMALTHEAERVLVQLREQFVARGNIVTEEFNAPTGHHSNVPDTQNLSQILLRENLRKFRTRHLHFGDSVSPDNDLALLSLLRREDDRVAPCTLDDHWPDSPVLSTVLKAP